MLMHIFEEPCDDISADIIMTLDLWMSLHVSAPWLVSFVAADRDSE
jgi:hypothetical protein